jgi:hypothetical protein
MLVDETVIAHMSKLAQNLSWRNDNIFNQHRGQESNWDLIEYVSHSSFTELRICPGMSKEQCPSEFVTETLLAALICWESNDAILTDSGFIVFKQHTSWPSFK